MLTLSRFSTRRLHRNFSLSCASFRSELPRRLNSADDIAAFLRQPSWDTASLLSPDKTDRKQETEEITREKLHHLLRLSALPLPKSEEEENGMIETLTSQLQLVKAVQEVDTKGVEPLVAIRDETREGLREARITLETVQEELDKEVQSGPYRRIVTKKTGTTSVKDGRSTTTDGSESDWDPIAAAPSKVGRFIKVNTEKS